MTNPYQDTSFRVVESWVRVHGNGEQTRVVLVQEGERDYSAVAYDVAPSTFEPIDSACIAAGPSAEGVRERARRWMQDNPKGVAPGTSGGWWGRIKAMAGALNDYGEQLIDEQQQNGGKQS